MDRIMISSEKLQERVELMRAGKLTDAPYAITLLEVAKKAHLNGQDNAPRLLLDAVDHRIREIDPDCDPWEAAQRMAKEKNNSGLRGGYWGIMMLEEDFQREGRYYPDDWQMCFDIAGILICALDLEYA